MEYYRLNPENDELTEALKCLDTVEFAMLMAYIQAGNNIAELSRQLKCSQPLLRKTMNIIKSKVKSQYNQIITL